MQNQSDLHSLVLGLQWRKWLQGWVWRKSLRQHQPRAWYRREPDSTAGLFFDGISFSAFNVSRPTLWIQDRRCPEYNFQCSASKVCIPKNWVCDGEKDCHDNSDELGCLKTTKPLPETDLATELTSDRVQATRNHQVRIEKKADLIPTLPILDWTQETHCPESEFSCATSRVCIPAVWVCDGQKDCADDSDELACSPPELKPNFEPRASNLPLTTEDSIRNQAIFELTSDEPLLLGGSTHTTSRPNGGDVLFKETIPAEHFHPTSTNENPTDFSEQSNVNFFSGRHTFLLSRLSILNFVWLFRVKFRKISVAPPSSTSDATTATCAFLRIGCAMERTTVPTARTKNRAILSVMRHKHRPKRTILRRNQMNTREPPSCRLISIQSIL